MKRNQRRIIALISCSVVLAAPAVSSLQPSKSSSRPWRHEASTQPPQPRRQFVQYGAVAILTAFCGLTSPTLAVCPEFRTQAQAEYTNSITASRDTNVSPQEAYDSILKYLPAAKSETSPRALDVGAGAGLSTSYLYNQLGYKTIDAVDWSADAWRANVQTTPDSVRFYEMDDDSFFSSREMVEKYNVICYNFAINPSKAVQVAQQWLTEDGVLFAPVNDRPEYWYKQTYYTINAKGQILQKSDADVGAWSVQFQPDVTSDTCIGIWCGNTNGFFEKRKAVRLTR